MPKPSRRKKKHPRKNRFRGWWLTYAVDIVFKLIVVVDRFSDWVA